MGAEKQAYCHKRAIILCHTMDIICFVSRFLQLAYLAFKEEIKVMGIDFANYQVFAGRSNAEVIYRDLLSQLPELMVKNGFQAVTQSEDVDRAIVIGPPDRWICVYDSSVKGINPTSQKAEQLAVALSDFGPVVNIAMYDSSIVHFFLYQQGHKVDQFVSASSFYLWYMKKWQPQAGYKESDFYGQLERWSGFLLAPNDADALKLAWKQKLPHDILQQTAKVVGWDSALCQGGYMVSDDGQFNFRYDEYFKSKQFKVNLSEVQTFHFRKIKR